MEEGRKIAASRIVWLSEEMDSGMGISILQDCFMNSN